MILLQIYFAISGENSAGFEAMYRDVYVPALRKQQGYLGSKLLRLFPAEAAKAIEASPTEFNYQMELVFDTEENRLKWVASTEHAEAWAKAASMAGSVAWRGYDVAGHDAP